MAAKSRLLLYYECNCNTQANIAHAVITTVRRYRGEGDSNRTRACGRGDIFLNSTRLDSTGLTELSVSRGRTGASFASSPNWRIFRCLCQTLVILFTTLTHTNKHTHTHTRMVLLTSCFAFIGLKCEIANKYQEFLSFLFFLSSFSRATLATTLPGLLNYLLSFFLFTVKRSSIALVCVLALVSCICEILSIAVPPGSSISKLPLTRLPHCNCTLSLALPLSLLVFLALLHLCIWSAFQTVHTRTHSRTMQFTSDWGVQLKSV